MVSKWRNGEGSFQTDKGSFDFELGLNSTKGRDSLDFSLRNPETENPVEQQYVDKETGEVVASSHYGCARAIQIGEEEAVFDRGQLDKIKETALSDSMNLQKVVDREDLDIAKIDKKAYHLTPQEDGEKKYAIIWHGLKSTDKVIYVKYAPSSSENLYVMWADDRGLWLSQMVYPEGFETAEFDTPDLSDKLKKKSKKLVEGWQEATNESEIVNDQREKVEEAIEKKMNGEELDVQAEQEKAEEQELEDELEAVL
jgi:non-homologous end joining protein Ku